MAKPLQKGRENRSAEKKDLAFHPYIISPESAHTSILLLDAVEPEIICQTLRAITKFAAQEMTNREILFDLDAISHILPHVEALELNIRRFALKALAQLCQLPRGPEQVLQDPQNLRKIASMLVRFEDVFVLEFASLVLAELTKEPLGCEQLLSANILSTLFARMKNSLDPDVQKNCLQTLSNLLEDPICAAEVTKNTQFSWPSLLALMQSKFLAIQHAAIKTVDQLICRYKDQVVQKTFRASSGVLDLCDILESYEFRDVHAMVLGVLRNYVETEENASHVYQSGCILRLLAYLDVALPAMKPHCLAVLTKMSYTANGREALFNTETDMVFCNQLLSSNVDLLADAAMGVANMTQLLASAVRMCDNTNIIDALCVIVADDSAIWFYIRLNALKAIVELCRVIPKAAFTVVESKSFTAIRNVNKKFAQTPIEAQRLAVQCYINLEIYHVSKKAMVNGDFMAELLAILQRPDISLKILTCTVLTGLMTEEIARDLFTLKKGEDPIGQRWHCCYLRCEPTAPSAGHLVVFGRGRSCVCFQLRRRVDDVKAHVISKNLLIEHVGLATALCSFIIASVSNEGADIYIDLGTVHYMVENRQARYIVSAWEPALEAIFRRHPSAKLAYTGRLDINDFTQEGFYCLKRLDDRFPSIQTVMMQTGRPRNPVFFCMFLQPSHDVGSGTNLASSYHLSDSKLATISGRMRFPPVPDDSNLREYLLKLRLWFGDPARSLHYFEIEDAHYEVRYREKCEEVSSSLKQRAQLLGEYVAEQMSGLSQERDCSMPSVDLHLADLMSDLASPVIGLGYVKCGGPLERALLYKVLADRVGIPCALFRSSSAYAWCEVGVPEIDPEEDREKVHNFPAGLLRANYIVDLMIKPGRLIPRGGRDSKKICGPVCSPPYISRKLPSVCKCEKKCD
ncbi:unnamed protein product [Spodoptera littoralis]|uniref:EDR1/CTR1/ARMC3-like peptidase-like domain-containing protein n=1 Tax=Spodoptera littoralis TaxID=7109 RepID=A0A9P0I5W5_SPOLI|nr:unnamed protein product [Spodoptera littoralis]CAH1639964.1 unnamed protein product [Spodoptera littoralis]